MRSSLLLLFWIAGSVGAVSYHHGTERFARKATATALRTVYQPASSPHFIAVQGLGFNIDATELTFQDSVATYVVKVDDMQTFTGDVVLERDPTPIRPAGLAFWVHGVEASAGEMSFNFGQIDDAEVMEMTPTVDEIQSQFEVSARSAAAKEAFRMAEDLTQKLLENGEHLVNPVEVAPFDPQTNAHALYILIDLEEINAQGLNTQQAHETRRARVQAALNGEQELPPYANGAPPQPLPNMNGDQPNANPNNVLNGVWGAANQLNDNNNNGGGSNGGGNNGGNNGGGNGPLGGALGNLFSGMNGLLEQRSTVHARAVPPFFVEYTTRGWVKLGRGRDQSKLDPESDGDSMVEAEVEEAAEETAEEAAEEVEQHRRRHRHHHRSRHHHHQESHQGILPHPLAHARARGDRFASAATKELQDRMGMTQQTTLAGGAQIGRMSPAPGAGTMGGLVVRAHNHPDRFGMTCHHVLADKGVVTQIGVVPPDVDPPVNSPIVQPKVAGEPEFGKTIGIERRDDNELYDYSVFQITDTSRQFDMCGVYRNMQRDQLGNIVAALIAPVSGVQLRADHVWKYGMRTHFTAGRIVSFVAQHGLRFRNTGWPRYLDTGISTSPLGMVYATNDKGFPADLKTVVVKFLRHADAVAALSVADREITAARAYDELIKRQFIANLACMKGDSGSFLVSEDDPRSPYSVSVSGLIDHLMCIQVDPTVSQVTEIEGRRWFQWNCDCYAQPMQRVLNDVNRQARTELGFQFEMCVESRRRNGGGGGGGGNSFVPSNPNPNPGIDNDPPPPASGDSPFFEPFSGGGKNNGNGGKSSGGKVDQFGKTSDVGPEGKFMRQARGRGRAHRSRAP